MAGKKFSSTVDTSSITDSTHSYVPDYSEPESIQNTLIRSLTAIVPALVIGIIIVMSQFYPLYSLLSGLAFAVFIAAFIEGPFFGSGATIFSLIVLYFLVHRVPLFKDIVFEEWYVFTAACSLILAFSYLVKDRKKMISHIISNDHKHPVEVKVKQNIKLLIWSCRSDGVWEYVNTQWEDFTGLTSEQLNKLGCEYIIHPDDISLMSAKWKQHLDSLEPFQIAIRLRGAKGVYHPTMTEFIPDEITDRRAKRWILASHLYNFLDQPQGLISKGEDKKELLESIPVLFAKIDIKHRIKVANKNFNSFFNNNQDTVDLPLVEVIGINAYSEIQSLIESLDLGGLETTSIVKVKKNNKLLPFKLKISHGDKNASNYILSWEEHSLLDGERGQKGDLFDDLPLFIWCKDATGKLIQSSKRLLEFVNVALDELSEGGEKLFIHPEDLRIYQSKWIDAQKRRTGFDLELRLVTPDNDTRLCSLKVVPVRGKEGRIIRWIMVADDHHTEKGLFAGESATIYQTIGDAVPNFLWSCSSSMHTDFVNKRWQDYTGLTLTELNEKGWFYPYHPDDQEKIKLVWEQAQKSLKPVETEFRYRSKNGEYKWFMTRAIPLKDDSGKVLKWVGTTTNIDSRKKMEEELRKKERRYRVAIEAGNIGVWEWDVKERVVIISNKLQAALGLPAGIAEFKVKEIFRKIYSEDRNPLSIVLQNSLKHGREFQKEVRVGNKGEKWFLIFGSINLDTHGNCTGIFGTAMDISDRKKIEIRLDELLTSEKQAREEAERLSSLKDQFLASVSAELKTPINAMVGWSNYFQKKPEQNKDLVSKLKVAERNAQSQSQMVENLLEISRIISGVVDINFSTVKVNTIVKDVTDSIMPLIKSKGVKLNLNFDNNFILSAEADPYRLQQSLWNCLNSLLRLATWGSSIGITIKKHKDIAMVLFVYNGPPSNMEVIKQIITEAENWNIIEEREEKLSALGFLLSKYLISMHKGSMSVNDNVEDSNIEIAVIIPLHQKLKEPLRIETPGPQKGLLHGKKVLLVNDDSNSRKILKQTLESLDLDVVQVGSTNEALKIFKDVKADVIISDLENKESDTAFIKQVRDIQGNKGAYTPAIAVAKVEGLSDRVEVISSGFQACIEMPVEAERLQNLIAGLVKGH